MNNIKKHLFSNSTQTVASIFGGVLFCVGIVLIIIVTSNIAGTYKYNIGDKYVTPLVDIEDPFSKELSINSMATIINIKHNYCQYTKSYKQCNQYSSINIKPDSLVCKIKIDTLSCICDDMTRFIYDRVHSKSSYIKIPPEYVDKIKYNEPLFYDRIYTNENGLIIK